jgi:hypothetical protein
MSRPLLLQTAALACAWSFGLGNPCLAEPRQQPVALSQRGQQHEAAHGRRLEALQAEIRKALPAVEPDLLAGFEQALEARRKAAVAEQAAGKALAGIDAARGLVEHAKGKWIGGAEKEIAKARLALEQADSDEKRQAASASLAHWEQNKREGEAALRERQASYDAVKSRQSALEKEHESARRLLQQAESAERSAAQVLLAKVRPVLDSEVLDDKLAECVILRSATPRGLAAFAQQGAAQEELLEALFRDPARMRMMLEAGGAKFGEYGRALEILAAISQVRRDAPDPVLRRLALATALEHARPIPQNNAKDAPGAPAHVDPVQRYQHYEKAYLEGELDPAFRNFTAWELRHVVNSDAPDAILSWGRSMLRNYRPDHVTNPDYGWRYAAAVRTEVPYGSQNVKDDLPALQQYQNIIMNGGVCGRRAFFGRFILRSFGIPTWGVTQRAHAALSHWTPDGWVVNLGAGFPHSWWDKDEFPRGGSDFLLETQARAHGPAYLPVLRAEWIGLALGEEARNPRMGREGGLWSRLAHLKRSELASSAADLGPLGQDLGEANEAREKQILRSDQAGPEDRKITLAADGAIVIPAVAHQNVSGRVAAMRGFSDGMQIHATAGYQAELRFAAPAAGIYRMSARVATVQNGHFLFVQANGSVPALAIPVINSMGDWVETEAVEVELREGINSLRMALREGSRGLTVREYVLRPR